jgi:soluble lytic murein transglycosylase
MEKLTYFQMVKKRNRCPRTAVLALFLFLVLPADLFQGEGAYWIDPVDQARGRGGHELLTIYSIVKSHGMDLGETSVWAIARTILEESRKHSLDPLLVLAVINVESGFRELAVSPEGARGLMQIRPIVANALAEKVDLGLGEIPHPDLLDDPILNIKLGVFYLRHLKKSFRQLELALTAYNWGPTEIRNRLEENEELPLEYAMKVLATYHSYRKGKGSTPLS